MRSKKDLIPIEDFGNISGAEARKRLHEVLNREKHTIALIRRYRAESDKCQYCNQPSIGGCAICPAGEAVQEDYKKYAKAGLLDEYMQIWNVDSTQTS